MDFDLSETQRMMQQAARTFLRDQCPADRVRKIMETETGLDEELWRGMAQQGWCGMTLPERVGGLELGLVELAAVAEELGRACAPGPLLSNLWAATLLEKAGGDREWVASLLADIAAGSRRTTVALLEPSADWEAGRVTLAAEPVEGGLRLSGKKTLVGDAATAEMILCAARHGSDLVLLGIPPAAQGLRITSAPTIDATRKFYDLDFDGVVLPASHVLAQGSPAEKALRGATNVATIALCAEMVGGMQWVLDTAVEYAKTRKQFDRPIGSFQAVQHQCADMLLMLESARSASYFAAWALSEKDAAAEGAVSIAKAYCSDAAREVGNRGIQVHGGIGFTWEHDLHLYYKRLKSAETMFGDATFHRERLASQLLDAQTV